MTDIPVSDLAPAPVQAAAGPNPLLDRPILRTLIGLATPNVIAMSIAVCITIAETSYIGRLGTEPLAAMAVVFPFVILTMTMSGGAMGGGVASAIARALGSGDIRRASALAQHAILIGLCFGLFFMVGMLVFGPTLLALLGARGRVLAEASAYTTIFFGGAVAPWMMNTLNSILRGTGNMRLPSSLVLVSALIQITLGGILALGLGPIPSFGMRGVACGTVTAFTVSSILSAAFLLTGRSRLDLIGTPLRFRREMFVDILKVGLLACLSPLQSVLTVTLFTHLLARFGTEVLAGYGIGARLEFLLTSIGFAIGIASVPMIGMAIGAGRIDRARRVAWTGGALTGVCIFVPGVLFALWPGGWSALFTSDPGVTRAASQYLHVAAPAYAWLGMAVALYFSAQGAARILGPVLAQTGRLVFITIGGWVLLHMEASVTAFYFLAASSMVLLGTSSALIIKLTPWGSRTHGVHRP